MPQNPNRDSVIPAAMRDGGRLPDAAKLFFGKDGEAAESLLALKGASPEGLIELARRSWGRRGEFNGRHAASLAEFATRFNEIRAEVGARREPAKERTL